MSDFVERLRWNAANSHTASRLNMAMDQQEAADEILRLRAELAALREPAGDLVAVAARATLLPMSEAPHIDGKEILAWEISRWGSPPRWRIIVWNDGINKTGYTWPCWMCAVCTLSADENHYAGWTPLPPPTDAAP